MNRFTPPANRNVFIKCVLPTLSCCFIASPLWAQDVIELPTTDIQGSRVTQDEGYTASQASTASKNDVPIKEEAQSINVVTQQTLDDYQVRSLGDAMKFVSGVSQGNTLGGSRDSLIKRGFGTNDDGSILRDGVRSNLGHNFSATTERVEVLKGPASMLYGALEPGGLINVISKKPEYTQSTTLSGSAYSEGGGTLGVDTTGPLGDTGLAYRLIAERGHEDYWRNYGVNESTLVAPSLAWTGERASLSLSYEYNEYSNPFDRGTVFTDGHPADIDYDKRLDERWAKSVGIRETATARFEYELSEAWKTRVTYGWNNDRYSLSIAQPSLSNAGKFQRAANGAHYDDETRYASWDFMGKQELFGQRHDLLIGVDNQVSDQYRGKTYRGTAQGGFDITAPVYGGLAEPGKINAAQSNLSNKLTSSSVYLKDNWHLDDRWILVFGGRYQHYDQFSETGMIKRVPVRDDNGDAFVPFLGLVYKADETLSLYGNYSRSFKPNDTVDDNLSTFKPEEGRSYEIGAKYDPLPGLNINLALFDIEKKNVVTNAVVGGKTIAEAAGKVGSQGLELDVTGRLAERWDLIGTYAYTHTEILDDPKNEGHRLSDAPKHTASLYLSHHLNVPAEFGAWHAGAGARYVGERAANNANDFWLSSYTVADAFLRWESPVLGYKTSLQLNVDNLFDKQYYPSSTGSQLQVAVGEPRTARLSASVTF
ncbi:MULTISPECIES: TonB-dependent siderophore receptor [unclassified Pseudomonas]|uniref:TonB-dependent siderophore receptor n=1 Tax=unclassified Pseudomonas TaxID=196821 RepID=UPI00119C4FE8|nr:MULTISPECIES: TonB-dependent siderophore receptor [unclassified Pseudomonas]TWC23139.1 iron complex outermembrane receptor protein [Pseudomonas sp. SJZ075]TWC24597.1 iron complex outermembrane receptor protein [Pseudomonas sp. SJZ074]TWC37981.1 iron complex outermembrane receptor protein [Pseudomonas sp. SJZ078]TWC41186.1 iron complex outermembrane receptor protein [Pseudomonas sp. SJZ085]TWC58571.1 iron complex outermembrane receptor protein [Pseudomonas sp. SJZ124]